MAIDFWSMLGYTNNANIFMEVFGGASNVILTSNPPFEQSDFISVFPIFPIGVENKDANGIYVPQEAFNLFLAMANAAIKYDRYKTSWNYFMCLYIAHYCTLFIQMISNPENVSAAQALQGAMPKGIATSKSVDGLSISYDLIQSDAMKDYGTWGLTTYGQQLVTLTRMYGHAGMWVNG